VLSRSAGAARELDTALQVDPNDIEDITSQIAAALLMSREERCSRWQNMMDVLLRHSIHAWFADFMQALKTLHPSPLAPARVSLPATTGRAALAHPHR
jgi:trehalose 6-phosphate synthase